MTLEEFYLECGGDYQKMIKTLKIDMLIKKFVLKFLNDTSFSLLSEAIAKDDTEAAFTAAHTLKGVCGNLAFTRLYNSACEITEHLRVKDLESAKTCFSAVQHDYELTVNAINKL
ncbi:MAG: Hpt domain-containing protein [Oscillospiraceae bacterium]|nr:Hpt domain-containing protein [Oscillospiraceae bacterium]